MGLRIALAIVLASTLHVAVASDNGVPRYKPSGRSPEPVDITISAYGASRSAPEALTIGEVAPDFVLPRAGGGTVSLTRARREGPVVILFYRGHW